MTPNPIGYLLFGCLVGLVLASSATAVNVFLTEGQTWLLFPHAEFSLYTYTTQCTPATPLKSLEHKQFEPISAVKFDNSCQKIDILMRPQANKEQFYYAKLAEDGVCTVYHVEGKEIRIYYQHDIGRHFNNILMLNQLNVLVWNAKQFVKVQFSLISKQINLYGMEFPSEDYRRCEINNQTSVLCWNETQLVLLDFLYDNLRLQVIPTDSEQVAQLFPLSPQDGTLLLCGRGLCNVSQLTEDDRLHVLSTVEFDSVIMGGSIYGQTNTFILVSPESVSLLSYNLYQKVELRVEQTIDFPLQFGCANYDHSILLNNLIIIECFTFDGRQGKLVLMKDPALNQYLPFNPVRTEAYSGCWISGNSNHLFILYDDSVVITQINFYFLELSEYTGLARVDLVCTRKIAIDIKQVQHFLITVMAAQLGKGYIDQTVEIEQAIVYDQLVTLELSKYFKASDILKYNFKSNCSFIKPFSYKPVLLQQYFSLYNREKCVRVLAGEGLTFYRLVQINQSIFYLEECQPLTFGYACQLSQIYDNIVSPHLILQHSRPLLFYLQNQQLKMQEGDQVTSVFDKEALSLEMKGGRLRVGAGGQYFISDVESVVRQRWEWRLEGLSDRLEHEGSLSALEAPAYTVLIKHHRSMVENGLQSDLLSYLSEQELVSQEGPFPLPCLLRDGNFNFIITKASMTKVYVREKPLVMYVMAINNQSNTISNIRLTDHYITVEYEEGHFEIYDGQEQAVSSRVVTVPRKIMTDIIVLDTNTILIPIESTTSLIKIEGEHSTTVGMFSPQYSLFQEHCNFKIELVRNPLAGLGLSLGLRLQGQAEEIEEGGQDIFQYFQLKVKYFIQKIDLDMSIEVQHQPDKCQDCVITLQESDYLGPIFSYDLNDDYYEQFVLRPHLSVKNCPPQSKQALKGMFEVRFEGDYLTGEVLMTDGHILYILDRHLNATRTATLPVPAFCLSYLHLHTKYLILCESSFLVLHKDGRLQQFAHGLNAWYKSRLEFQLQAEEVSAGEHYVIVMEEDITVHIYLLSLEKKTLEQLENYTFTRMVEDLKIVNHKIIILEDQHICIGQQRIQTPRSALESAVRTCLPLARLIPGRYASDYHYHSFLPYRSNDTAIQALLLAKHVGSLHIDLLIDLTAPALQFTILNAYAGFEGLQLHEAISVNTTAEGYSYFILHYLAEHDASSIIAYYHHNTRFAVDGTIGQIRSAEFLENYFGRPSNLTYASFPGQMYVHSSKLTADPLAGKKVVKDRGCILVGVRDDLSILLNYKEVPPIRFLILEASNLNQKSEHFIRVYFSPTSSQLGYSVLCLGVVVLLLVSLMVATNRCKHTDSDLEADLIYEEVTFPIKDSTLLTNSFGYSRDEEEEDEGLPRDSTSLLHSKEQEYLPPDSEGGSSEIMMIREE